MKTERIVEIVDFVVVVVLAMVAFAPLLVPAAVLFSPTNALIAEVVVVVTVAVVAVVLVDPWYCATNASRTAIRSSAISSVASATPGRPGTPRPPGGPGGPGGPGALNFAIAAVEVALRGGRQQDVSSEKVRDVSSIKLLTLATAMCNRVRPCYLIITIQPKDSGA